MIECELFVDALYYYCIITGRRLENGDANYVITTYYHHYVAEKDILINFVATLFVFLIHPSKDLNQK